MDCDWYSLTNNPTIVAFLWLASPHGWRLVEVCVLASGYGVCRWRLPQSLVVIGYGFFFNRQGCPSVYVRFVWGVAG